MSDDFDNYFGVCPYCRRNDGMLYVGRTHWMVCHTHKVTWCLGANIFSGWRHQDAATFERNEKLLRTYEVIEPLATWTEPPEWSARRAAKDAIEPMKIQEWLRIRKEAALTLDPETARVRFEYGCVGDPYGVLDTAPPECIGCIFFASAPDSDLWIAFSDLPHATEKRLRQRLPEAMDWPLW